MFEDYERNILPGVKKSTKSTHGFEPKTGFPLF